MTKVNSNDQVREAGSEKLAGFPVVRAEEYFEKGPGYGPHPDSTVEQGAGASFRGTTPTPQASADQSPKLDEPGFRLLRAVSEQPLLPSSSYPRLARMSPKTAGLLRSSLVTAGFLRERTLDPAGRGRGAIICEVTALGKAAIEAFQRKEA